MHKVTNPAKSKLLCFNVSSSDISPIYLNGTPVTVVDNVDKCQMSNVTMLTKQLPQR